MRVACQQGESQFYQQSGVRLGISPGISGKAGVRSVLFALLLALA